MYKVAIIGANGKMGKAIADGLEPIKDIDVVKKIDINDSTQNLENVDIAIDFTVFDASRKILPEIVKQKIDVIVGTSGWQSNLDELKKLEELAKKNNVNVLIAPNFSIGAVLEKQFAMKAAEYFESAEIIEMHHSEKKDAPSGTAVDTALNVGKKMKNKVKDLTEKGFEARGKDVDGIKIHSIRQPGLLAHQEISFAGNGERLTIKHDSFSRESFVKGVILAVKNIKNNKGLTIGLENYF